jgi:murein DD-endopeptidase MepM/ murein hydrolase activator NlpD
VTQGRVIGYVGSTGLSTGPHLDFRMRWGTTYINPLSVNLPSADPVPAAVLPDFYFVSRVHFAALDYFPNGSTEGREDFFTLAYRAGPSAGLIPGAGGMADHPIP